MLCAEILGMIGDLYFLSIESTEGEVSWVVFFFKGGDLQTTKVFLLFELTQMAPYFF